MMNKEDCLKIKKIAFINQRYGAEVAGGSESYTRAMAEQLAERLQGKAQIEVLTSKAVDFVTWRDYYDSAVECLNKVTVRRFSVKRKRSRVIQRGMQILMQYFHLHARCVEELRLKGRGPYVPSLVEYIKEHKEEYDAFVFVTYMYYPAYFGAKEVYDKAYFIPTAHDEEPIYMNLYRELFNRVRGIVYLTEEEKTFVEKTFHNEKLPNQVLGMGIEVPPCADAAGFRKKYGIEGDYLLYAGRMEEGKGCKELIDFFLKYKKKTEQKAGKSDLKLVLMGKGTMEIPSGADIRYVGFVSDEDKYNGMAGAAVICLPSRYESFSISLLEGMAYGKPALVNGHCEVLRGHVQKSGGGFAYMDYEGFEKGIQSLLDRSVYEETGRKAAAYVRERYTWDKITESFCTMLGL